MFYVCVGKLVKVCTRKVNNGTVFKTIEKYREERRNLPNGFHKYEKG